MQNRYAGDIGDFMKFGLLRHLAGAGAGADGMSIGLNWYLAPDEVRRNDGRFIEYLDPANRWHRSLLECDPDLLPRLAHVVQTGRSVEALEASGALPPGAPTHRELLRLAKGPDGRRAWHRRALDALAAAELVFVDPDNGIRAPANGAKLDKFARLEELSDYATRGQSLVAYHHADREKGTTAQSQARERLRELADHVGQTPVGAVIARRWSCRFFLVTATDAHRRTLAAALDAHAARWAPHVELV